MSLFSRNSIPWVVSAVCIAIAYAVQFSAPAIAELFYAQNQFDLLNFLTFSDGERSLGYYIGRMENVLTGPVSNIIFHLVFAFLCLKYFLNVNVKRFTFLVFTFLIVTKFNVLLYPFYGDGVGGPFAEALWLADHNFDYFGLMRETGYAAGGQRVYFASIYPTFLAILIKLIPSTNVFLIVNHLFVFAFTAIIAALTRAIAQKAFDARVATLTSIILLSVCIFQSQTEAINMEMPCLLFSVISIYYLVEKKIGRASAFAILSVLVKGHGVLTCAAVMFVSVLLFFFDEDKRLRRCPKMILMGLSPMIGIALIVGSKFLLNDQHVSVGMIALGKGWPSLRGMPIFYTFVVSVVLFFAVTAKRAGQDSFIRTLLDKHYTGFVVFVAMTMWFVLFMNFYAVSPRYKLALLPFFVLSLVYLAGLLTPLKKKGAVLLTITLILTSLGSYGAFYKPLETNHHVLLERSLEYRSELKLHRQLVRYLDENFRGFTIGAPFILAQMLAIEKLGYVKKPLDVMIYGMPLKYGNVRKFTGLNEMDIKRTVWVSETPEYPTRAGFTYPVHQKDKIIKRMDRERNQVTLFAGGLAIHQMYLLVNAYGQNKK